MLIVVHVLATAMVARTRPPGRICTLEVVVIVSAHETHAAQVARKLVRSIASVRAVWAMLAPSKLETRAVISACALSLLALACDDAKTPALSRVEPVVRTAPEPPENGPQLGVIAEQVLVREYTDTGAPSLGELRAGARVARSSQPVSRRGCEGGWYAVRPRGFVCVGVEATLDLSHPTLSAMALAPRIESALPYTYARARSETPLFERAPNQPDAVREVGKLRRRAGMAVVGSWKAKEPSGTESRLALLTDGRFVRAADLEAAKPSEFTGIELNKNVELPVAFVVKRGVRSFSVNGTDVEKGDLIDYHSKLLLSGRFRSVGSVKYWAVGEVVGRPAAPAEQWVRHQDVTVVQKRTTFPEFVKDDTRWLDASVITGTLVLYEGRRPVFATLLSVARELPGGADAGTQPVSDGPRAVPLGTVSVKQKALTLGRKRDVFGEPFEVADAPWSIELSSGQLLHGAYWHDRFGIEHGAGSFALSPGDAARVFRFVGPALPTGWHSVTHPPAPATLVVIRR